MADDLAHLDATAQADLVRRGDATPTELVDAAIARIEAVDPELHAVVLRRFDAARAEAAAADLPDGHSDRPFRGVPFLTKDLSCTTAGEPHTEGMRALRQAGVVATETTHLANRFRRAGFVNLGRTNSPELGLLPTTEPDAWGPTHNPWDLTRTPGGSSGGSAAAVAAGLVPVAHASDGGGSIRIPAAACGLVGLKTSRGRVSVGPARNDLVALMSVQFAVTRSVRDAATLLDVCGGEEPGDPIVPAPPDRPYATFAARASDGDAPDPLRIGMMTRAPGDASPVDPECVAAVEQAARTLQGLGHHVEVAHPAAYDDPARGAIFGSLWGVNAATQVKGWGEALGRPLTEDDVEPATWFLATNGRDTTALDYYDALNAAVRWSRTMAEWWHGDDAFDLLLTPTLGEPPPPLGSFAPTEVNPYAGLVRSGSFTPYTPAFNLTGQPAISLPLHWTPAGLPVGVHLVAAYGREDLLLAVAATLEVATPWAGRTPPVHA